MGDLPSAQWGDGAAGGLGYTEMGQEDLSKILLLLQDWDFGLQQDAILCQTGEEGAG